MTASTEGTILRRAFTAALFTSASFAATLFLAGMITPVCAQTSGGETEDGSTARTFRNDVSIGAGTVGQTLYYSGIFGPGERVLERRHWSSSLRYTHVFADLPHDDAHRHDVSRLLFRAGHVGVEVSEGPVQAMEPDELRLDVSVTKLVAPSVALGGRYTKVYADGMLYHRSSRTRPTERARATMLALLADIWLSPRVMLRESVGGGGFIRENDFMPTPEDGPVLCVGHELHLDVSRTISYSHILRLEWWDEYHRMYDLINRVEIAMHHNLVGSVGLRAAHFHTAEFTTESALGLLAGVRYHPIPEAYVEASASVLATLQLFVSRNQREFQVSVGTRF